MFWRKFLVSRRHHFVVNNSRTVNFRSSYDGLSILDWRNSLTRNFTSTWDHTLIHFKFLLDCLVFWWLNTVFPREKPWYQFSFWIHSMPFSFCSMCTARRRKRSLEWFNYSLLAVSRVFSRLTSLNHRVIDTLCVHSRLWWIKSSDIRCPSHR